MRVLTRELLREQALSWSGEPSPPLLSRFLGVHFGEVVLEDAGGGGPFE